MSCISKKTYRLIGAILFCWYPWNILYIPLLQIIYQIWIKNMQSCFGGSPFFCCKYSKYSTQALSSDEKISAEVSNADNWCTTLELFIQLRLGSWVGIFEPMNLITKLCFLSSTTLGACFAIVFSHFPTFSVVGCFLLLP